MTTTTLTTQLADQLDWHWTGQLRPRLDGLTDEEYFWQPVRDCWTVHPDGVIDFSHPAPEPAPFTAKPSITAPKSLVSEIFTHIPTTRREIDRCPDCRLPSPTNAIV